MFIPTTQLTQGGAFWTQVLKTITESVDTSTVVQNDDELFFTAEAGKLYEIILCILYDSPAGGTTPDLKCDTGEDAAIRGQLNGIVVSTADAATAVGIASNQTATFAAGTVNSERMALFQGTHRGNGGTFRLRWAQNTSNANATRVLAGSFIRYRVVV